MKTAKQIMEEVKAEQAALKEKMIAARPQVEKCFTDFFDKYPDLLAFSWTQYTPYFDDGSRCEFGIYWNDEVALKSLQPAKAGVRTTFNNEPLFEGYGDLKVNGKDIWCVPWRFRTEEHKVVMFDIRDTVLGIEPILEQLYGDGVRVTVSRPVEGGEVLIEVIEYEHD